MFILYLALAAIAAAVYNHFMPRRAKTVMTNIQAGFYTVGRYLKIARSHVSAYYRAAIWIATGYISLFAFALFLGYEPFTIFVLLVGAVPAFMLAYALYLLESPVDVASQKLIAAGKRFNKGVPVTFDLPTWGNPARSKGAIKKFFLTLLLPVTIVLNGAYLTVALPAKGTAGLLIAFGYTVEAAAKSVRIMARLFATLVLALLFVLSLSAFGATTDIHLVSPITVGIALVIIMAITTGSVLVDQKSEGVGMRGSAWAMGVAIVIFMLISLAPEISPDIASGIGHRAEIEHDAFAKWLHLADVEDEDTKDLYAVVIEDVPFLSKPKKLRDGSMGWEQVPKQIGHEKDPAVPKGTYGVRVDPHVKGIKKNTRQVIEPMYYASDDDPDLIYPDTKADEGTQNIAYTPKRYLRFFKTIDEAKKAAEELRHPATSQQVGYVHTPVYTQQSPGFTTLPSSVSGSGPWKVVYDPREVYSTGIKVAAGKTVTISATGLVHLDDDPKVPDVGPRGALYKANTLPGSKDFPDPNAFFGQLLMRVDDIIYDVGAGGQFVMTKGGSIEILVNDRWYFFGDNRGNEYLHISVR